MPLVLAPAEVLAGLIAICVLFAAYLIAQIVSAIFQAVPIPIIGGKIADAFSWLAQHALTSLSWLWDKTNPIAVFTALTNIWHDTEQGLHVALFGDVNGALQWLYHTAIPGAAAWTLGQVHQLYDGFVAGANALFSGILGFITWAHAQFAALWQAVTVTLPGLVRQAEAVAANDLGVAVRGVEADIASAEAAAVHAIAIAIAGVEAWTTARIGDAVGVVEGDIGRVRDLVTASVIPQLVILSRTLTTTVADVARVDECTAPICESGSGPNLGNLGKGLQALDSFLSDAALFALLALAASNPKGAAEAVAGVFAGPVEATTALFRQEIKA